MKKEEPKEECESYARHLWTKKDIREVIELWETMTPTELAEKIGCTESGVIFMAYQLRKEGFPLARRKRKNGVIRKLVREVISEYKK